MEGSYILSASQSEHEGTRNASEKAKKDSQRYRTASTGQETNLGVFGWEKR